MNFQKPPSFTLALSTALLLHGAVLAALYCLPPPAHDDEKVGAPVEVELMMTGNPAVTSPTPDTAAAPRLEKTAAAKDAAAKAVVPTAKPAFTSAPARPAAIPTEALALASVNADSNLITPHATATLPAAEVKASSATSSTTSALASSANSLGQTSATVELPASDAAYLNNPLPVYPPLSKRLGEQGQVLVKVLISAQGHAQQAAIAQSSGFKRLDDAALNAVQSWRFVPGKRGGVPQAMWFNVPVEFGLRGEN